MAGLRKKGVTMKNHKKDKIARTVIKQHYHLIYKEKLPHGVVSVDINIFTPFSEIGAAFAALDKIFMEDVKVHTSET